MTLQEAILRAEEQLNSFAFQDSLFADLTTAFGNNYDQEAASFLINQWQTSDFNSFPEIEIRSSAEINGANGAYSADTNKIYIAEEYLRKNAENLSAISALVLEEYGHYLDAQINKSDTDGDEGDVFAKLVRGETITESELAVLRAEDDTATVTLDGEVIEIEQNNSITITEDNDNFTVSADFFGTTGSPNVLVLQIDKNQQYELTSITDSSGIATDFTFLGATVDIQTVNVTIDRDPNTNGNQPEFELQGAITIPSLNGFEGTINGNNNLIVNEQQVYLTGAEFTVQDIQLLSNYLTLSDVTVNFDATANSFSGNAKVQSSTGTDIDVTLEFDENGLQQITATNNNNEQEINLGLFDATLSTIGFTPDRNPDTGANWEPELELQGTIGISSLPGLTATVNDANKLLVNQHGATLSGGATFYAQEIQLLSNYLTLSDVTVNFDATANSFSGNAKVQSSTGTDIDVTLEFDENGLQQITATNNNNEQEINLGLFDATLSTIGFTPDRNPDTGANWEPELELQGTIGISSLPGLTATVDDTNKLLVNQYGATLSGGATFYAQEIQLLSNYLTLSEVRVDFDATDNSFSGNATVRSSTGTDIDVTLEFDENGLQQITATNNNNEQEINLGLFDVTLSTIGFTPDRKPDDEDDWDPQLALGGTIEIPSFQGLTATLDGTNQQLIVNEEEVYLTGATFEAQDITLGNFTIKNIQATASFDEANNTKTFSGSATLTSGTREIAALGLAFDDNGLNNITASNINFDLGILSVTDVNIEFTPDREPNVGEDWDPEFQVQGMLNLPALNGFGVGVTGDDYMLVNNDGFSLTGLTVGIDNIPLVAGWKIKDAQATVSIDTSNNQTKLAVDASGTIEMPSGIDVTAEVSWDDDKLTSIAIGAYDLNKPIGNTGAYFQSIDASYSAEDGDVFNVDAQITAGPTVNLNLPDFLGGPINESLINLDVNATITPDFLNAQGNISILRDLITGTGEVNLNYEYRSFLIDANLNFLDGLMTADATLIARTRDDDNDPDILPEVDFYGFGEGSVKVPSSIPLIGGAELSSGGVYFQYIDDSNNSNDYVAFWGDLPVLGFSGVKINLHNPNPADISSVGNGIKDGASNHITSLKRNINGTYTISPYDAPSGGGNDFLDAVGQTLSAVGDSVSNAANQAANQAANLWNNTQHLFNNIGNTIIEGGREYQYRGDNNRYGGSGNDNLNGYSGNDRLHGGDGNDILYGGNNYQDRITTPWSWRNISGGNDTLYGDGGDDTLNGQNGNDKLYGGDNNDRLNGGSDSDTLKGGPGNDTILGGTGGNEYDELYGEDGDDSLNGENGNDRLHGGNHDDLLDGGSNNDILHGDGGEDKLLGSYGDDWLYGGADNDTLDGGSNNDLLYGNGGDDKLLGSYENDTLYGGDGNDFLDGGSNNDTLYGDGGDDVLFGSYEDDELYGGAGNDILDGGSNNDFLSGGQGDDTLLGSYENDTLNGGAGNDQLYGDNIGESGYAGNDELYGGDGNDTLYGGHNNDTLNGGAGVDTASYNYSSSAVNVNLSTQTEFEAGTGTGGEAEGDRLYNIENLLGSNFNDRLNGDNLNNKLQGGGGIDTLVGGAGNDTLHGQQDNDFLYGDAGDDSIEGNAGDDELHGWFGSDTLVGGTGNDTFYGQQDNDFLYGGAGADRIDGGDGNDTASYNYSSSAVNVNLSTGIGTGGEAQGDRLYNIENLLGSDFNDTLIGSTGNNELQGGAGADELRGAAGNDEVHGEDGNDEVHGGDGNDEVHGGDGNDILYGGAGADTLDGGAGADTASYQNSSSAVRVNLSTGTGTLGEAQGDRLYNIENIIGSNHADLIQGDETNDINNKLEGGNGNDTLSGGIGDDTLEGGTGNDVIYGGNYSLSDSENGQDTLIGGDGNDKLIGAYGNDSLEGGNGNDELRGGNFNGYEISGIYTNDTLRGGAGDDTLEGGSGDDTLEGGTGADTFFFNYLNGIDTIKDFNSNQNDRIQISTSVFGNGDINDISYNASTGVISFNNYQLAILENPTGFDSTDSSLFSIV